MEGTVGFIESFTQFKKRNWVRSCPTSAEEKNALPGADTVPRSPKGQPAKSHLSFSRVNRAPALSTWPSACPSPAPTARHIHVALRGQWGASGRAARLVPEGSPCAGLQRRLSVFPEGWPASVVTGLAPRCRRCTEARGPPTPGSQAGRPGTVV